MTNDTRPPVAPKEGHYAMLRNGQIVRNLTAMEAYVYEAYFCDEFKGSHIFDKQGRCWSSDGIRFDRLDIIATISPADMQAAASGELERLRAALNDIYEMWAGSEGFIPHTAPEGYLLMLVKKMADRAALAKGESK